MTLVKQHHFYIPVLFSPSSLSYEDTYNTLKYADRAKNIKSSLVKNVVSVDLHLSQYPKLVKELQAEVCKQKSSLVPSTDTKLFRLRITAFV